MNGTIYMPVGEVCSSISDTYREKKNMVTLINTSDVLEGRVLNHERVPNFNLKGQFKKTFQRDDILYSEIRPQNRRFAYVDFSPIDYIASTKLMVIRAKKDVVSPKYLYYFLKNSSTVAELQLLAETRSGTFPQITFSEVANLTIPVPSLAVQEVIVQTMQCLEDKITCNEQINDNLEQQAKLLYDYWFTQFDFPDENGKPYRSSGGKMVWNEQLKMEIPFSWICSKMENAIEAVRTGLNPRNNFQLGNGNIQYITVKNLCLNGSLDFSGCDTIDEQARQIVHRRSDIQRDDILFASIAPLGRCYLIQENPTNWDINESVFSIRYNSSVLTAEYLYMNLQSETFVKRATACSTGSIFKGIRINSLMDSEIILPPLSVTKEFSKEIKPLLALQKELDRETHTLIQLRDWLLPMLMNGQATISD